MKDKLQWEESHSGKVVHLILNSPENLNAMDLSMAEAFRAAKSRLENHEGLRLVAIRGRGRAFSAGGDLEMLKLKAQKSLATNEEEMLWFYRSFLGLRDLNVPLVCALHGHVVGAGFCFASACDVRVADETCLLSAPFARLALHPGMGGSYFLPRCFGPEVARELMLTGRRMAAPEAQKLGYLAAVTSPDQLHQELEALLSNILKSAPEATRALLVRQREDEAEVVERTLKREATEQAKCYQRPEFLGGVEALQRKEAPPWLEKA